MAPQHVFSYSLVSLKTYLNPPQELILHVEGSQMWQGAGVGGVDSICVVDTTSRFSYTTRREHLSYSPRTKKICYEVIFCVYKDRWPLGSP